MKIIVLKFSWWAIAGLPHSASEGRLMKVFSEFGEVNLGINKSFHFLIVLDLLRTFNFN